MALERNTAQRRAILDAIVKTDRPLTPDEILQAAREAVPRMGMATVYRAVKALEASGKIVAVELPGEGRRFEAAGKKHHHHFHCRGCGRMFDLHGCTGNFQALLPAGFRMEDHEVFLYGQCRECSRNR
ncbi:MAG: transcriptional repressor [Candidatus Hydrogenedens sp.]|nr:transcriptional repressor [Candidatus Hydrogenedens sp.]